MALVRGNDMTAEQKVCYCFDLRIVIDVGLRLYLDNANMSKF